MKPLLVVKTGTTLPELRERRGDYEQWIEAGLELESTRLEIASVYLGDALPAPSRVGGVVVTGSSAMVSEREPWSEAAAVWLVTAVEADVPLLGICYGHQLLAHALGGSVGPNPRGREIGSVEIDLARAAGDALLGDVGARCVFNVTHVESVLELPPGVTRLASNAAEPNHAFRLRGGNRRAWGIQFHPEFDGEVIRGYIDSRRALLAEEGLDPDRLSACAQDTPEGPALLRRFGRMVEAGRS